MQEYRGWVSENLFHNGGKMTLALLVLGVVALGLLATSVYDIVVPESDQSLRYINPQIIQEEGPFAPGDSFHVTGIKCNDSDDTIVVTSVTKFQRLEPTRIGYTIAEGGGGRAPGCAEQTFVNIVPQTGDLDAFGRPMLVEPGSWRFEGVECPGEGDCVTWVTEVFEVVDAR